jgi:hypothetical protein
VDPAVQQQFVLHRVQRHALLEEANRFFEVFQFRPGGTATPEFLGEQPLRTLAQQPGVCWDLGRHY